MDRIRYRRENTNTTGGFKVARLEVFGGDYQQRPDVERLIILITDGVPTYDVDQLDAEVNAVKRMGIRILGLGVTNKVLFHASYHDFCVHGFTIFPADAGEAKRTAISRCTAQRYYVKRREVDDSYLRKIYVSS